MQVTSGRKEAKFLWEQEQRFSSNMKKSWFQAFLENNLWK